MQDIDQKILKDFRRFIYGVITGIADDADDELRDQVKDYASKIVNGKRYMKMFVSAFTTQAWARANDEKDDLETLEFIGDQTLRVPISKFTVSEAIRHDIKLTPGFQTKVKNFFEKGSFAYKLAAKVGIEDWFKKLGRYLDEKGETRPSDKKTKRYWKTVEDVFEAFMGAMFCSVENVAGNIGDAYTLTHTFVSKLLEESKEFVRIDKDFETRIDAINKLKDHMEGLKVNYKGEIYRVFLKIPEKARNGQGSYKDGEYTVHYIGYYRIGYPSFSDKDESNVVIFKGRSRTQHDFDLVKESLCLSALNYINQDENGRPRFAKDQIVLLNSIDTVEIHSSEFERELFSIPLYANHVGVVPFEDVYTDDGKPRTEAIRGGFMGRGRGGFEGRGRGGFEGRGRGRGGFEGSRGRGRGGFEGSRGRGRGQVKTFAKKV